MKQYIEFVADRLCWNWALTSSTEWRTPLTSWRTSHWRERPTSLRNGLESTRGWESCPVPWTILSDWMLTSRESVDGHWTCWTLKRLFLASGHSGTSLHNHFGLRFYRCHLVWNQNFGSLS